MREPQQDPSTAHLPPAQAIELRDLVREPDADLLAAVYDQVMRPAFAEDERESLEEIAAQVEEGTQLRMLAAFDPSGEPLGVVTSDWYPDARVMLIGYLAVSPTSRGGGIGRSILSRALADWSADLQPELCLAEVEDPRYFPVSEHGDPQARVRFYERLGGRIVALPYFQPRLSPDTQRVQHQMLMSLLPQPDGSDRVRTAPIALFLEQYFVYSEGPEVLDDPDFRALRWQVLCEPTVELLSGTELDRLPLFDEARAARAED